MGHIAARWLLGLLAFAGLGWAQGYLEPVTGERALLRVDVVSPRGDFITGARWRFVNGETAFASGVLHDVPAGPHRIVAGEGAARDIRVVAGVNRVVVVVEFVRVTDEPVYERELQFAGLPAGCSLGLLRGLTGVERTFPISGDRRAMEPLGVGMYSIVFLSEKGVCGVGGFVLDGSGTGPIRVVVAPVGGGGASRR